MYSLSKHGALVPIEPLAEENGVSIGYVCDCKEEYMPKAALRKK